MLEIAFIVAKHLEAIEVAHAIFVQENVMGNGEHYKLKKKICGFYKKKSTY